MRAFLLCGPLATLLGCAAAPPATPPPPLTAEERHQACASRMYSARIRGAVHWHIYENCLSETQ